MNNTTKYILIAIILVLIIYILVLVNKKPIVKDCYNLPDSPEPAIFGPSYWFAFHDLTHRIPCPSCRTFAEKFMVFFHDVVNRKLEKKVYDQQNYDEMKAYLLTT